MSVIIFFSASKTIFFCRNDVQAIDILRKGSYAPVNVNIYCDRWIHLISLVPIFVDWEKRYFVKLLNSWIADYKKNKKKGFEILKFVDVHFKLVDFAILYPELSFLLRYTTVRVSVAGTTTLDREWDFACRASTVKCSF